MFGLPSLQAIIAYSTIPILIGFAIVNYRQTWYSVMTFIFICINVTYGVFFYLAFMYDDYRRTYEKPEITPQPVREPLRYKDMSDPAYQVVTEAVTFDVERNFAAALLRLFKGGADYKLTEQWWWDTGKWQEIGGASKKQMQAFLQDWERRGLLTKANPLAKNSTRRVPVGGWRKIDGIAQGHRPYSPTDTSPTANIR